MRYNNSMPRESNAQKENHLIFEDITTILTTYLVAWEVDGQKVNEEEEGMSLCPYQQCLGKTR